MSSEENIRNQLKILLDKNPTVHISVSYSKPRIAVENQPVTLLGVYTHMFCVQTCDPIQTKRYTIRYGEIIAGSVKIQELH